MRTGTILTFCALMLTAITCGCGGLPGSFTHAPLTVSGRVHGGQQPVADSNIQVYVVGTTGDGSPAATLLNTTVTTSDGTGNATNSNANAGNGFNSLPAGYFTITGDYTCPSSTSEVYLVSTSGDPGLGSLNPNLALIAAIGPCGNLTPSTSIQVNEITTVAAAASLASFATGYAGIGSFPSDAAALQSAFLNVNEIVDNTTGAIPGPALPAGNEIPVAMINTLADIIAACVNSSGGVAGDGSPCGILFKQTTPIGLGAPSDTFVAALNLIAFPTNNVPQTFDLLTPLAPFQPVLSAAPAFWSAAPIPIGQTVTPSYPAMFGLDLYLPFTDDNGNRLADVTGNGHDGVLSGTAEAATFPGLVGIVMNGQVVTMPNASGRPAFGTCAYFPAGGGPSNYGYFYGPLVPGMQNGANLSSDYGPGNGIYHAADAYFPMIGRSNGGPSTVAAIGFSGIHCVEGIPADINNSLDHIIVDGQELPYVIQGQTYDVVGGGETALPMFLDGYRGIQNGNPITTYSVWASTNADSVAVAQNRTSSELARLRYLGVPLTPPVSTATDSTCSFDGTSIDQGFQAGGVLTSSLLTLNFPCTIHDFSESGQPPMDMNFGFQDRAATVYHPDAPRNIAYTGGVVNGVIKYLEPPQLAYQDIVNWNDKAHALGYKTIVSTMMSTCLSGYNSEAGDQLAQQFNALLLANAEQFDWVDNLAAWPALGASNACSGPDFADGLHPNTTGQALYVFNESAAFNGVYPTAATQISGPYSQLPSDRNIQASGNAPFSIQLIDANAASFNSAGRLCVRNTSAQPVTLVPTTTETINGAASLPINTGETVCVRPEVADVNAAGANWIVN